MILVGTISSAQAVRREDLPKPDLTFSRFQQHFAVTTLMR